MGAEDFGARLSERRWWGMSARSTRHLTTCSPEMQAGGRSLELICVAILRTRGVLGREEQATGSEVYSY